MDLRVLVLTADDELGGLVRAQVENLGCPCTVASSYDEASAALTWAEAAVVDLVGDGLDHLNGLRVEAPLLRTLAIAPDAERAEAAQAAGADAVLVEPFPVADLVAGLRGLGTSGSSAVVDLRDGGTSSATPADDVPWFSTR